MFKETTCRKFFQNNKKMRRNLLYIALCATSLWAMTACSDDAIVQEKNEDDNGRSPIELSAGVSNGNFNDMLTRAIITDGKGKTKRAFEKTTNLFFIVKAEDGNSTSGHTIGEVKWGYNYATAAAATDAQKDNGAIKAETKSSITFYDNYLYWDDAYARDTKVSVYSIAANNTQMTSAGLGKHYSDSFNDAYTHHKVGESGDGVKKRINFGEETSVTGETDDNRFWTGWTIKAGDINWNTPGGGTGQSYQNKTSFESQDLIYSNNLADNTSNSKPDGRLYFHTDTKKFDKGDLIFYHALTKFTIKIIAGDGFTASSTSNDFKFTSCPNEQDNSFAINGFNGRGDFNIKTGEFVSHDKSPLKVNYTSIYLAKTDKQKGNPYYTLNAYVIPGTDMTDTKSDAFSFEIDNNKFYISLAHLYNAIKNGATNVAIQGNEPTKVDPSILDEITTGEGGKKLKAGVNYEFTFKVNKTDIDITATITDWDEVESESVSPIININTSWGNTASSSANTFSFYRSESYPYATTPAENKMSGYSTGVSGNTTNFYAEESELSKSGDNWSMDPILYWTSHKTHYHMRGVYPKTEAKEDSQYSNSTYDWSAPRVGKDANSNQVIAVKNVAYTSNTFPSDLAIGMPELTEQTKNCNNSDHTSVDMTKYGICATEGKVNLNFRYMMSQVEVRMTTTTGNDKVALEGAVVEVVNIYNDGNIRLGDRLSNRFDDGVTMATTSYTLNALPSADTNNRGEALAANVRHSAIVPQPLTYTNGTDTKYLRFKITITNSDGTTDIYYANIGPILKSGSTTEKVAPNGKWEAGKHYIYNLKLSKTVINCTATLADWVNVEGSDNIWF